MDETIHASCVTRSRQGVLLLGPSGAGKSDLALRLVQAGCELVADDRVALSLADGRLRAEAPVNLAGLLELRGFGLVQLPARRNSPLALAVKLLHQAEDETRLPEPQSCHFLGVALPLLSLYPFHASAPAKILTALDCLAGRARLVTGAWEEAGE